MKNESLEKIGLLRSLDPKEIAALDRRCHLAARPSQGMAAGAGRRRHRHLLS